MEEQCEEVDMNSAKMDPLEWTVRKVVSIPTQYYFETGNYGVSFRTKVWHRSIQLAGKSVKGAEAVGGFFAGLLGLTNSRYDDVLAYMSQEEIDAAREKARLEREKRRELDRERELQEKQNIQVV